MPSNHSQTIPPPGSMEKWSFMKPVLGAKKIGGSLSYTKKGRSTIVR